MSEDPVIEAFIVLPIVLAGCLWAFAQYLRQQKTSARWPHLLLGNALVLVLLLSLSLLGGEAYYRYVYDKPDAMGYTKVNENWMSRHWHLNEFGVRDNIEYSPAPQPGKRRVSFLGDSFTVGHGINNVEDRFGNIIRRAHPEWEVHVLGSRGFDTGDEIQRMEIAFAMDYKVDEIVLVYCLNDIADITPEWTVTQHSVFDTAEQTGFWVRNSYLINLLYYRIKVRRNPYVKDYYGFVREAYRGPLWEQQKQRLRQFRDLVQSHGGRLSVVTFPFFHALGPKYEYQFVHDELNQCWKELGIPHLDLLPIYRNLPPSKLIVSRNDPHPNEYAHALAAKAIDKFLVEQMAVKNDNRALSIGH
jgi:lysophospholipase L1-like esterase